MPYFGAQIYRTFVRPLSRLFNKIFSYWFAQIIACLVIIAAIVTFIVIDSEGLLLLVELSNLLSESNIKFTLYHDNCPFTINVSVEIF